MTQVLKAGMDSGRAGVEGWNPAAMDAATEMTIHESRKRAISTRLSRVSGNDF